MRSRPSSQFVVGSFVSLLADGQVHRVIWRGKQTMPSCSDWPGEIAVYRLNNDYWDCYYEYRLYPASPWDNSMPAQLIVAGCFSPLWQPHPMRIVFERYAADEAAQHHGALLALIDAYLDKEAAALIRQVVEVYATLVFLALGQVVPCLSTQYNCTMCERRRKAQKFMPVSY